MGLIVKGPTSHIGVPGMDSQLSLMTPLAQTLRGSSDRSSNWLPATHTGVLDYVPSSQLQPQPQPQPQSPPSVIILGVNQQMWAFSSVSNIF